MATSREKRGTDIPPQDRDEVESGRLAPIDEKVEGELNAALPELSEPEKGPPQDSS